MSKENKMLKTILVDRESAVDFVKRMTREHNAMGARIEKALNEIHQWHKIHQWYEIRRRWGTS